MALLLALLGLWGFWLEPRSLHLRTERIDLSGWPKEDDGLRIALLADLHTGSAWNDAVKLREIVRRTNAAEPHLVLLLGDYVVHGVLGGHEVPPETVASLLGDLRAPLGVYAVLGNHDGWLDHDRVRDALQGSGIPVIEEKAVRLETAAGPVWIAGIGDLWTGPHDVGAALAGVTDDAPVVLLTHNPDVFPDVPPRVAITLAGHTHGGQVRLPLLGRPVVPSIFGQRYAAGHVVDGGRHLYVATGVGTSIVPVRFRVPPAVTIVALN